ncbi:MAG: ice-binding family protein [Cyclonatronaceae bacterium]
MKTDNQLFKSISLTALLFGGFAAAGFAQDTNKIVDPETKAPVILTTAPGGGEMNVGLSSVIEITFSSDMDETSLNGTTLLLQATFATATPGNQRDVMLNDQIRDRAAIRGSENSRHAATGAVNGTISYSDKVARFTPNGELQEGTLYTFTVTNGVKDSENIALETSQSWSFTTSGTPNSANLNMPNNRFGMERSESNRRTTDASQKDKATMIDLGKAGHFVILAKTTINNESKSRITGHTGEGSVTDESKIDKPKNENASTDAKRKSTSNRALVLQSSQSDTTSPDVDDAIEDMMAAYSDASMQSGNNVTTHKNEHFKSNKLTPGVHEWSNSLHLESDVTLSGSADDVWLFKIRNDLTMDEDIVITLTDGATADNVFWYVEGEVTIGKNAQFEGIILSMDEITLEKGAKLNGRMFSQAAISLDENTVTEPKSKPIQTSSIKR